MFLCFMLVRVVFVVLFVVNIGVFDIQCFECKMNGEVVIIFKFDVFKEKFLILNVIFIDSESYVI